jgi:hypothetical protein
MAGRRQFRDKLTTIANFDNISQEQGVDAIRNAWKMSLQIVRPVELAATAAELAEFFQAEVIRIEAEQE